MTHDNLSLRLSRRSFVPLLGGSFVLAACGLDAADSEPLDVRRNLKEELIRRLPTRWKRIENRTYLSFQREVAIDGEWCFSGYTLPIKKSTNQPVAPRDGFLDPELVPRDVHEIGSRGTFDGALTSDMPPANLPDQAIRDRDGLPPSEWIRSRDAKQLSRWLRTIDVPYVGVEQMTMWNHLTLHHEFKPNLISGLTNQELGLLHSAAHYGY